MKSGSREALAILWQEHSGHVLNLAFRMLKDRDQAEDILMDVFVQVPRSVQKFRGESNLGTWLYRLTVNACLMKLRAERRHAELEEENWDTIVESGLGTEENWGAIVESSLGTEEKEQEFDTELLTLGLNQLPAETRSMLWLKDAEGLDIKDLTEIYRMPDGTIKARLSRARHFVKDFLTRKQKNA